MSPAQAVDYWILVGDELLADGKWHDGDTVMQKMQAAITPGVAIRRTERVRRHSSDAEERKKPVSVSHQILMGTRSIVVQHVHSRVNNGAWEVDPWPVPPGGWKQGDWRVRNLRLNRKNIAELERYFHIDGVQLRRLIKQEPPLEYTMRGRSLYLPDSQLPALKKRVNVYLEESAERRRAGGRRRWERTKSAEPTELSVTQLARRSNMAVASATRLRLANPGLGWVLHGATQYKLPLSRLPEWDQVVAAYKSGYDERRAQANRRSAAEYRAARDAISLADDTPPTE